MKYSLKEERLKVASVRGGQLAVHRIEPEQPKGVVLMVHGLGSSSQAFLGAQKGLAPFLAEMGYSCLLVDLVGHGQSWPSPSRHLNHGIHTIINEDLPRLLAETRRLSRGKDIFLLGQGLGGVLLASAYARCPSVRPQVAGLLHFGVRRQTRHTQGFKDFYWRRILPFLGFVLGKVPINWLASAAEAENIALYREYLEWSTGPWIERATEDGDDDFDYAAAAQSLDWPPSLYFARRKGGYADQLDDVRDFMREMGTHNGRLLVLGKGDGNVRNYRFEQLTRHDDAWVDHFPVVLEWLDERVRGAGSSPSKPRLRVVS